MGTYGTGVYGPMVLSGLEALKLGISVILAPTATDCVFDRELRVIPVVSDWHASRICALIDDEPVPANWFH